MTVKICILVSTYENGIFRLPGVIKQRHQSLTYIVVHQVFNASDLSRYNDFLDREITHRDDVELITTIGKGVTKSRNLAIKNINNECDYVIFCDDDVVVENDIIDTVVKGFEITDYDVITFSVSDPEGTHLLKQYPTQSKKHDDYSILKVGTIEIAAKAEIFRQYPDINFPEYLGAGSEYPLCDEPVFLKRIMNAGFSLGFLPDVIMRHPLESSGKTIKSKNEMMSRGIAFREIFGFKSVFINLAFFLKAFNKINYNKWQAFKDIYAGALLSKNKLEKH